MDYIISTGFTDDNKRMVFKKIYEAYYEEIGLIYDNFPLNSGNVNRKNTDILVLTKEKGYLVIDISLWNPMHEISELNFIINSLIEKYYDLTGRFNSKKILRVNGICKYKGKAILVLPLISNEELHKLEGIEDDEVLILTMDHLQKNDFASFLDEINDGCSKLEDEEWSCVKSIVQGTDILQQEIRSDIKSKHSKGYIIQQLNSKINSLDLEQEKVARQIPPGPQRIRGLAGSGKTVVLAMKAALMHIANPSWDIAYVFYTQALYDTIKDYITRFTEHFARREPDWNKLKILHGWGGKNQDGLYSYVSNQHGIKPLNFNEAKRIFGESPSLLGKCCEKMIKEYQINEMFDAILMDEAQDFDYEFFRFCRHILREPKRLIWAYDEVQSLSNLDIPTALEIFGTDNEGNPLVSLEGTYDNGIEKDYILYHCYRNPRPVLVAAHFFGMGLFRKEGAIQFIPNAGGWEDIGYEIKSGEFIPGQKVTLRRPFENSPNMIEKIVGYESLLVTKVFDSLEDEVSWVAEQIIQNVKDEEVNPEDILVICLDNKYYRAYSSSLKLKLQEQGINLFLVGNDATSNKFRERNSVTFSGIRRAKGNESAIVYVLGFDTINQGIDVVTKRNIAFTAMTRCKGWCVLTGVGEDARILFEEINLILKNPEEITFTVPNPETIQRTLDNIEYEKRRNRIKKADKFIDQLTKLIDTSDAKFLNREKVNKLLEILIPKGD